MVATRLHQTKVSRRDFLGLSLAGLAGLPLVRGADSSKSNDDLAATLIGYTEYQTNLKGGRHANVRTMRACIIRADGTGRRVLAEELTKKEDSWTQFAGWSPDGRFAIIGSGYNSPENAAWEEEHKQFRHTQGWLYDVYLLDIATDKLTNLTSVERVSNYNSGLFYWPNDPKRLGFQAIIDGNSHPFSMDLDGKNKKDLTRDSSEFAYGFSASPDGKRIAYHKSYQLYVADADGANARKIETEKPFNFVPLWSADGQWILFLCGEHYDCHPHVVMRDGTGLKKIADRQGYRGVVEFLDVPDHHGGSSDVPAWSPDSAAIYYTTKVEKSIELMRATLDCKVEQLTHTKAALNYHPNVAADGKRILFGSNRTDTRQLYVIQSDGKDERAVTSVKPGWGAMWGYWRPAQ